MFSFPLKFVSSSFLVIIYNLFNYNPSPQISFNVFHIYLLFMAHYSGLTNVPGSLSQEETVPHSQRLTARSSSYQVSFENSNKPGMVTPAFRSSTGKKKQTDLCEVKTNEISTGVLGHPRPHSETLVSGK